MPSTWTSCRLCVLLLLTGCTFSIAAEESIEIGLFSQAGVDRVLPENWQPLTFKRIDRHTDYALVEEGGRRVVRAASEQAASGLIRPVSIDPERYPLLQWQWKVNNVLRQGNVHRRDGDDYAARVYVTFAYDPDRAGYLEQFEYQAARLLFGEALPYRAIAYIWGSNSRAGSMVENPYTNNVMMFVLQAGEEHLQQWVTETRNVYQDYITAFGEEPPMVTGVAIMTDTDNTGESAVAWYGDIKFRMSSTDPDIPSPRPSP